MKRKAFRHELYRILEAQYGGRLAKLDQLLFTILIILDISCFILGTSQPLDRSYHWLFRGVAIFSTIVFTLEYMLRLWLCTVDRRFRHPLWGRIRYAFTPMAIIDFISTFPFYLLLILHNFAFLKTLRLLRLARILKIGRHSRSVRSLVRVIISKQEELLVTLSIISFLLIIASSLMFFAEHDAQPDVFSSIPASMWWGVVTLTTVGYGDIYPVTAIGKLLGAGLACFGIGVFVLPAGIVASGFAKEVADEIIPEVTKEQVLESAKQQHLSADKLELSQPDRQIQANAELLKNCLVATRQTMGRDLPEDEINSWAMFLYLQTKEDSNCSKL